MIIVENYRKQCNVIGFFLTQVKEYNKFISMLLNLIIDNMPKVRHKNLYHDKK
jgi:hypothetical protein